jgi:hypothetical protein
MSTKWRLGARALGVSLASDNFAHADETGLGFWLPGQFGSFAAAPSVPGLSIGGHIFHPVSAGASKTFLQGGRFETGIQGRGDLGVLGATWVFATPVFGGQAAVSLFGLGGRNVASIDATLTGPKGNTTSGSESQSLTSIGDLNSQASLKWNQGVSNFMIYGMGDIPVGDYNSAHLANLGIGHAAIDGGAGYTYFDPVAGHEFSTVIGLSYNFINPSTQYQNGLDAHLDWGASQFVNKQLNVGVVGYVFEQVTGDHGAGGRFGGFESGVAGIGPQLSVLPGRRQDPGRREREGLLGVRSREPTPRVERMGDACLLSGAAEKGGSSVAVAGRAECAERKSAAGRKPPAHSAAGKGR